MAGSNYDVNIKLDVRKINQQISNLERRISKLNALAQGKRGDSKILLKNERDKAALILKQERAQKRVNKELAKTAALQKGMMEEAEAPKHVEALADAAEQAYDAGMDVDEITEFIEQHLKGKMGD